MRFLVLLMLHCPSLSSRLKQFLSRRLWSSSWLPCRQRLSSWDRRRLQKSWPVLVASSKNSRLSKWHANLAMQSSRLRIKSDLWWAHLTCRLVSKDQEIQMLQAELGARTKELSEKVEQMHQQVRNYHNIAHFSLLSDMFYNFKLGRFIQLWKTKKT